MHLLDKESCQCLLETSPILCIKHVPKYRSEVEFLVVWYMEYLSLVLFEYAWTVKIKTQPVHTHLIPIDLEPNGRSFGFKSIGKL